jgi:hypothetical protein
LVEPLPSPPKSTIIDVVSKEDRPERGTILAVGEKVRDLEPGMTVLFNTAATIATGVENRVLVLESNVYLVIEEEAGATSV